MADAAPLPFWVRCSGCDHCWVAANLPCDAAGLAHTLARARCPLCGAAELTVARQDNGRLLETVDG